MVEVVGKIVEQSVSILIDLGYTHNYITPKVLEICAFKKTKHSESWLVQLATRTKRKVSKVVERCPLQMDGLFTWKNMNIFPLGSYDVLIGMDFLEAHKVKLDFYRKNFKCTDEEGNLRIVKGIPRVVSIRQISSLQLKNLFINGCQLYATHVLGIMEMNFPSWRTIICCKNSGMHFLMKC